MSRRAILLIISVLALGLGLTLFLRAKSAREARASAEAARKAASESPYGSCAVFEDSWKDTKGTGPASTFTPVPKTVSLHILGLVRTDVGAAQDVEVRLFKEIPAPKDGDEPLDVAHSDAQGRFRFDVNEDVPYLVICKLAGYAELRSPFRAGKAAEVVLKR